MFRGNDIGRYAISTAARPQGMFALVFALFATAFALVFNFVVLTDPEAAAHRFDVLSEAGSDRRAAPYGERMLRLRARAGDDAETLAPLKARVAAAQAGARRYARAAALYEQTLATQWSRTLTPLERAAMEDVLARAHIAAGDLDKAASIYAYFLGFAGDEGARGATEDEDTAEAFYADRVAEAMDMFAEALKPTGSPDRFEGAPEARLAVADKLAELGAFYAMRADGAHAAAGLLATAYEIRRQLLGGDHLDTVQIALLLGPVYTEMGRLNDAERIYLDAFHAQEKVKGASSPDLSLYIKLLVDVYKRQGRTTEAQALWEHMQGLFRDAFGAQRYAANRVRDRRWDVNRPVSQFFVLSADYAPDDLVRASDYSIPVGKHYELDEMKLRLAADPGAKDVRENNLPARLAQLMSLCRNETGERIALRSGYRSYETQVTLFDLNGANGKTAPAGMSEHQLGLAVDIDVGGRLMRRSDKTYQCFEENAYQFGFILSFPPGNNYLPGDDAFEPWHWRYVGVATAQLYREAGPIHKPQEFLAALPCYQEHAQSGGFAPIGDGDLCLEGAQVGVREAASGNDTQGGFLGAAFGGTREPKAARKLNNGSEGAPSR